MTKFQRMDGVVIAVFTNRGYAFPVGEDDGLRYFLHFRDFKNEDEFQLLEPGDIVNCTGFKTPGQGQPRGLVVRTVKKLPVAA